MKPHIWYSTYSNLWWCGYLRDFGDERYFGVGDTVEQAYEGWVKLKGGGSE